MPRSKRYTEEKGQVEDKLYEPKEAVELLKNINKLKFDPSVDLTVKLGIDHEKTEQYVRGTISLPHSTGKTVKIAAFVSDAKKAEAEKAGADIVGGEELIEEIKKTEKTDFEIAVAEPTMMPMIGKIARILGPRGLMPSPKNETVSLDVAKTIEELKRGKLSFKNDDTGNIHVMIGKLSLDTEELVENLKAFVDAVNKVKPDAVKGVLIAKTVISTSQSPGIRVKF